MHVHVTLHIEHLRHPAAGAPACERAVGVVHGPQEAVAPTEGGELPHWREVTWERCRHEGENAS